jgi:hypothetical protein
MPPSDMGFFRKSSAEANPSNDLLISNLGRKFQENIVKKISMDSFLIDHIKRFKTENLSLEEILIVIADLIRYHITLELGVPGPSESGKELKQRFWRYEAKFAGLFVEDGSLESMGMVRVFAVWNLFRMINFIDLTELMPTEPDPTDGNMDAILNQVRESAFFHAEMIYQAHLMGIPIFSDDYQRWLGHKQADRWFPLT